MAATALGLRIVDWRELTPAEKFSIPR